MCDGRPRQEVKEGPDRQQVVSKASSTTVMTEDVVVGKKGKEV